MTGDSVDKVVEEVQPKDITNRINGGLKVKEIKVSDFEEVYNSLENHYHKIKQNSSIMMSCEFYQYQAKIEAINELKMRLYLKVNGRK